MNCEKCLCPLILLRVARNKTEKRSLCARCRTAAAREKGQPQRLLIDDMSLVRRISREFYANRDRKGR